MKRKSSVPLVYKAESRGSFLRCRIAKVAQHPIASVICSLDIFIFIFYIINIFTIFNIKLFPVIMFILFLLFFIWMFILCYLKKKSKSLFPIDLFYLLLYTNYMCSIIFPFPYFLSIF